MSLAVWIKPNAYPETESEYYGIISSVKHGLANGFSLKIWDSPNWGGREITFGFFRSGNGKIVFIDSPFPDLGHWSHWVYTVNYSAEPPILAYKDNAPDTTANLHECCPMGLSDGILKNELVFGNLYVDNTTIHPYYPNIEIDEVLIFDYILSNSEVNLVYNA